MVASWGHVPALLTPSFSSSISAQSNFAVGAVVNATFGSITELTFYITALIKGSREGNRCYAEIVKSALTGTLVGCVLFVPVSHGGTRAPGLRRELGGCCKQSVGDFWEDELPSAPLLSPFLGVGLDDL